MPIDHHETRDCGCVLLHRRVYVCEKHAAMPEKIRDRISELVSQTMAKEVEAAVAIERKRCMSGYQSLNDFFITIQEFEHAKKVQRWIEELSH